jgi:hypothetical protein
MLAPLALSSYLATRSADAALEAFETEIDETVSERENMIIARFHTISSSHGRKINAAKTFSGKLSTTSSPGRRYRQIAGLTTRHMKLDSIVSRIVQMA